MAAYSCQQKTTSQIDIYTVLTKDLAQHNLSEIFEKDKMIELETSDSSLIGGIRQIVKTNDYYFIAQINGISQFDTTGKFVRNIGSRGRGPGQYLLIGAIAADSNKLFVAAYDKIMCYDFKGNFLKSEAVKPRIDYLTIVNNELWVFDYHIHAEKDKNLFNVIYQLYKYDQHLNIFDSIVIRKYQQNRNLTSESYYKHYISQLNLNTYLFIPNLGYPRENPSDTLYEITAKSYTPVLRLDFSDMIESANHVEIDMGYDKVIFKNLSLLNVYRTNNYLFADYGYNGIYCLFCYNLDTNQKYNVREGFSDDLFNTGKARIRPLKPGSEEFYFIKEGYELEGIISGIKETNNPVIFLIKLRHY